MSGIDQQVERLKSQISSIESMLDGLKTKLTSFEQLYSSGSTIEGDAQPEQATTTDQAQGAAPNDISTASEATPSACVSDSPTVSPANLKLTSSSPQLRPLPLDDYKCYGRQMILPQIGLTGQLALKNASILLVGLGGLGCPAAMYLAGAGVGSLGLMDGDDVEISNLHRQILHRTEMIGKRKVYSAAETLRCVNPSIRYTVYPYHLTSQNALQTFAQYDMILDCTDHPTSRYLISDAAVLAGKPLISASALKTEGQLLVLNYPPNDRSGESHDGNFCYRCVFPKPPPPESVLSCGEGGILGPVVGVMGVLMATEAIKIITNTPTQDSTRVHPRMLLYSAYSDPPFRSIRLNGKRRDCTSCGATPSISAQSLHEGSIDYVAFCGTANRPVLPAEQRISAREYSRLVHDAEDINDIITVDVRPETEYGICHLPQSVNISLSDIQRNPSVLAPSLDTASANKVPLHFVCRFGNDSQEAVRLADTFRQGKTALADVKIVDIRGGLKAWRDEAEAGFPEY